VWLIARTTIVKKHLSKKAIVSTPQIVKLKPDIFVFFIYLILILSKNHWVDTAYLTLNLPAKNSSLISVAAKNV
jgi:hypothetical protein